MGASFWVGESGPEIYVPKNSGQILPTRTWSDYGLLMTFRWIRRFFGWSN